jgi:hypothetical protein
MSDDKLHIYDAVDPALTLKRDGENFHDLAIWGGVPELRDALKKFVKEGKTFTKVLWSTHGKAGRIGLSRADDHDEVAGYTYTPVDFDDSITYLSFIKDEWTGQGYEKLFPLPTKMYFAGCNVAEGDVGWKFLANAGALFLKGGGTVTGWTSYGINTFGGHITHFWGHTRTVTFGAQGLVVRSETTEIPERNRRQLWGPVVQPGPPPR